MSESLRQRIVRLWQRLDRRLRPHRYWTQAELDAADRRAERLAKELGWK